MRTLGQEMADKYGEDPHILFAEERISGDDPRVPTPGARETQR